MTLIRCGVCGGSKKVRGLGGMLVPCNSCKGIGFKKEIIQCEDEMPDEEIVLEVAPKRGRKHNRTTNPEIAREALV